MSRDQFLAELTQYLTFVSPADRDKLVSAFVEKFDSVGPSGEASLIMELGTPMSIAIALKRRKEAGELIFSEAPAEEPEKDAESRSSEQSVDDDGSPVASQAEGPVFETEAESIPEQPETEPETSPSEIPVDRVTVSEAAVIEEAVVEEAAVESPLTENILAGDAEPESSPTDTLIEQIITEKAAADEIPAISSVGSPPQINIQKTASRKELSAPAVIGASLLSVVIAAVMLVLAAAGGYLVVIMANFIFAALQTLSTAADALWMLAIGFIAGALGVLIVWLSLWIAISLIRRLFFGRADEKSKYRLRMKKIWKAVWIIVAIFAVVGIGCGVAGYLNGGVLNDLFDNPAFSVLYNWLNTNTVSKLISTIVPV